MRDLIIVGAGGFAREVAGAVHALRRTWRLLGYVDDDPATHDRQFGGIPVRGPSDVVCALPDVAVVVCVGSPRDYGVRQRIVRRLRLPAHRYATVVHPSADVGPGCAVGTGSALLAQVVLTADATVGTHVAIMPQAVVTHDCRVSDYATIASGVRLGGRVRIGPGAYVGAGALIREGVTIGDSALVGMGSVVLSDVPPGQVWAGNPARYRRPADLSETTAGRARR